MRYTAGQINYGGRVTDDWDRRAIVHLLSMHYDAAVVEGSHKFDDSGVYKQVGRVSLRFAPPRRAAPSPVRVTTRSALRLQLPDSALLPDYLQYVRGLPIHDRPELFGLHANADISCAQSAAFAGLAALLSLQPRAVAVGAGATGPTSAEQAVLEAASALLEQIPDPMDLGPIMDK